MTQIHKQIDALVFRMKRLSALQDFRFVREYAGANIETPVRGLLAAVCIVGEEREKGFIGGYLTSAHRGESYAAKAEIRAYAPRSENGSGLSDAVSRLMAGLDVADEEHIITELGASSIEFDANLNAIFRTVSFSVAFSVSEGGAE